MPPPRDRNDIVLRARALRRNLTLPEGMLWQVLRQRPSGIKFRRQHPIDRWIMDFYCPAARLVIEIDGMSRDMGDNPERDRRRDTALRDRGLEVIRFAARDILNDTDAVVAAILSAVGARLPLHQALPGSPPHGRVAGRD